MKLRKKLAIILSTTILFQYGPVGITFPSTKISNKAEYGFKLVKQTYISSRKTTVMEYFHEKTGAKLLFFKNSDPNKFFDISFRTLTSDNTGVNHILEHCLMTSSQKYPANYPALECMKQSLSTNVCNAGTTDDHTDYYEGSSNEKEFMNMMDVILNGVFYPSVLNNRNIFLQEGGHYELNANKTKAQFTGVVYGEVGKSSPEDNIYYDAVDSVLPNTSYHFNVGGNDENIPNATYEAVLNTYKKYYKPSNSYIYLYGNVDIDKALQFIDSNYLSKLNNQKVDISSNLQKPFQKCVEKTYYYDGTPSNNSTYFSKGYVIDSIKNADVVNAYNILPNIIIPKIKDAEEKNGLSLFMPLCGLIDTYKQPLFFISCNSGDKSKSTIFKKVINDTLNNIVKKGIDKNEIKSLLMNYQEKKYGENLSVNNGINYFKYIAESWISGGDPTLYLDADEYIKILNKELKSRYLENMIQKYLINNKHTSFVTISAKKGNSISNDGTINTNKLTKDQLNKIISDNKNLKEWQAQANSEKALSTLHMLSASDIKLNKPEIKSKLYNGTKMMFTPLDTNGYAYSNFYFDTSMIKQKQIPYITLLCDILSKRSKNKLYDTFQLKNLGYGEINFSADAYGTYDSTSKYSPKLKVFVSSPESNMKEFFQSLKEIMTKGSFDDKDEIKSCISDSKASNEIYKYYYFLSSCFSDSDKYNDCLKGYGYSYFLNNLSSHFNSDWKEIQNNLNEVYKIVFNKNNLITGFVGSNNAYANFSKCLPDFIKDFKHNTSTPAKYSLEGNAKNIGIENESSNLSVGKGYNFKTLGYHYSGNMQVLSAVIENYLFNKSRQMGGYGGEATVKQNGYIYFDVSRMPSINSSFEFLDTLPSYLKSFTASSNEMMKYKIAAVKKTVNAESQVWAAIDNQESLITGETTKNFQKELDEILNTKCEDIRNMYEMVKSILHKNQYIVYGGKDVLNAQKSLFNKIIKISE